MILIHSSEGTHMAILHPTDRRFSYAEGDRPLSGYTIDHPVGRGGFGEVYAAHSEGGKEVALKLITEGDLSREMNVLNLSHPHLVPMFDVRQEAGENWIVMEYLSGGTLADLLDANPQGLSEEEVLTIMRGLLEGLDYLHQKNIIHRDLKPGNLLFDAEGRPRIGDYGLSKALTDSQGSRGTREVGSIHYMAPEIFNGKSGKPSDIYACGILLHELLTGTVPFVGETQAEIMRKHLMDAPNLENLPKAWQPVIETALAKDAQLRYGSAREMLEAIEKIAGQPPTERAKPIQVPVSKVPQKRGWLNSLWCSLIGAEPEAPQRETRTVSSNSSQSGSIVGGLRIPKAEGDFLWTCRKYNKLCQQRDVQLKQYRMDSPHLKPLNDEIATLEEDVKRTALEYHSLLEIKIQELEAEKQRLIAEEGFLETAKPIVRLIQKMKTLKERQPPIHQDTEKLVGFVTPKTQPEQSEAEKKEEELERTQKFIRAFWVSMGLLYLCEFCWFYSTHGWDFHPLMWGHESGNSMLSIMIIVPLIFAVIPAKLWVSLFQPMFQSVFRFLRHKTVNLLVAMLPKSEV